MMKFVFVAMIMTTQAIADVAKVENCVSEPTSPTFLECDVTNIGAIPIAEIHYTVEISQPDRAVPWVKPDPKNYRLRRVEGGIEPGEKISLLFSSDSLSRRADPEKVTYKVIAIQSFDPSGAAIAP